MFLELQFLLNCGSAIEGLLKCVNVIFQMSYNGEARGRLTCAVTVGVAQNVTLISQEQESPEIRALLDFLVGVLVNLTASAITGQ